MSVICLNKKDQLLLRLFSTPQNDVVEKMFLKTTTKSNSRKISVEVETAKINSREIFGKPQIAKINFCEMLEENIREN